MKWSRQSDGSQRWPAAAIVKTRLKAAWLLLPLLIRAGTLAIGARDLTIDALPSDRPQWLTSELYAVFVR